MPSFRGKELVCLFYYVSQLSEPKKITSVYPCGLVYILYEYRREHLSEVSSRLNHDYGLETTRLPVSYEGDVGKISKLNVR